MRGLVIFAFLAACSRGAPSAKATVRLEPIADAAAITRAASRFAPADTAWCDRLAAENARVLESAGVPKQCKPGIECVAKNGAAWGFVAADAKGPIAKDDPCDLHVHVTLARSDGDRTVQASAGFDLELDGATDFIYHFESANVMMLGDLDGDGEEEALATHAVIVHEGPHESDAIVWCVRDKKVVAYEPARGLAIVEAKDIDGDGRFDFITRGPYEGVIGMTGVPSEFRAGPAIFVRHVKRDGTLSADDDVARAYVARQCAADDIDDGAKVACARMHGKTQAEALDDYKREHHCVDFAGDYSRVGSCPEWVVDIAKVVPSVIP